MNQNPYMGNNNNQNQYQQGVYQQNGTQQTNQNVQPNGQNPVLNMSDVELVAQYEKNKNKKPAIMLMIAAVFAIVVGIIYNPLMNAIDGTSKTTNTATSNTTTITTSNLNCTYNTTAQAEGTNTSIALSLNFDSSKLTGYTKSLTVTPITGSTTGATTITTMTTAYQALEANAITGYTIKTTATSSELKSLLTVDLTTLDPTKLTTAYTGNAFTNVTYTKDMTIDEAKAVATTEGYTCS
jgi:hypothetical protein